jgi:RNA polymerase sigma factor (sigma-70 family)
VTPDRVTEREDGSRRFATTRWSVVLSSADLHTDEAKAREALAQLCRIYWRPIFAFICRRGHSIEDAQDLTQDFFVKVLEGNLLPLADPRRGRFRSLLLKALQHFLIDAHQERRTRIRGGAVQFVSWDDWLAEAPSQLSVPAKALELWPAEKLYDLRWAATLAERALDRLAEDCEKRGRRRAFDCLSSYLAADRADVSFEQAARELGVREAVVKQLLYQLRLRYRRLLRAEVAATIANAADVDEELRYLCIALAAGEE